uniref:Uncharacterized protein n=1 Tax=Alexandrium monilatum TaxID=311494 RepID=A0A7S4SMF8_9DINO
MVQEDSDTSCAQLMEGRLFLGYDPHLKRFIPTQEFLAESRADAGAAPEEGPGAPTGGRAGEAGDARGEQRLVAVRLAEELAQTRRDLLQKLEALSALQKQLMKSESTDSRGERLHT